MPFGAMTAMAAPDGQGGCDGAAVQVLPSSLSSGKVRDIASTRGKQVADLAWVSLMQDAAGDIRAVAARLGSRWQP